MTLLAEEQLAGLPPESLALIVARGESLARRAAAMDELVRAGERALPALLAGARGRDPNASLFFLQVLGHIHAPEALEVLREMASHSDLLLAQAAVEGLGHQRDRESLPLMLRMLHADPWLALPAIDALAEIGDPRAIEPLEQMRSDEILKEAAETALVALRTSPGTEEPDA
jgi:HEAT repeat protein